MALTKISTGGVKDDAASQAKIADEAIDEARLQVSNAGTNGQFLQKSSGTGGLTWATVDTNLSSDTTPQLGGDVDTNDHNIEFKDRNGTDDANVLNFGAGDDMRLYSDGTNGYLQADTELRIGTASSTTNAVFTSTKFDFRQDVDITNSKKLGIGGSYGSSGQVLTSGGSGAAPSWAAVPPAGNTFTAVANGSIANNKAVKLDSDGKVSQIAESVSDLSVPTAISSNLSLTYTPDVARYLRLARVSDTQYAAIWLDQNSKVVSRLITVDSAGNVFSCHTPLTDGPQMQEVNGTDNNAQDLDIAYDSNTGKLLAVWTSTSSRHCHGKVGTISGTGTSASITWDTSTTEIRNGGASDPTYGNKLVWNEDTNSFGYFCYTRGSDDKGYARMVTINSSGGIELGTMATILPWTQQDQPLEEIYSLDAVYDTTNNYFVVYATGKYSNKYRSSGNVLSTSGSGTSATLSTVTSYQGDIVMWQYNDTSANGRHKLVQCCYDPSKDLVLVTYIDEDTAGSGHNHLYVRLSKKKSSNNDYAVGSATTMVAATTSTWSIVYSPGINKPVLIWINSSGQVESKILTISGTSTSSSISYSTSTVIHSSTDWDDKLNTGWQYQNLGQWCRAEASAAGGRILVPVQKTAGAGTIGHIVPIKVQNVVSNFTVADSYVGFADAAYTNGQTVTVKTVGNNVGTLSGLTIGSKYYVQGDGTVGTTAYSTSAVAGIAIAADKLLIREPT